MKNIKLVAKILLLVISLMSVLTLTACVDGDDGGYVNRRLDFEDIDKMDKFIDSHSSKEYLYTALMLDKNEFVIEYKYIIDVIAKIQKKSDLYQMDSAKIEGIFELSEDSGVDSKIEVAFHSTNLQNKVYIDENSTFEIKAVNNDEMKQLFSSRYEAAKYTYRYNYAVLSDGVAVMHVVISSNQEKSEDYLSKICDMLLENITIIK